MIASESLPQEFNVATWFVDRNVVEGRGARPAFRYEGRVLTYADVQDLANRTGNALRELGVGMEDRVWMCCLDAPEFLGTFWGAIKLGAIPVPSNTLLRAADYVYFLRDSRAKVAVVSAPLLAEVGPALGQSPWLRHVIVAGGPAGPHLAWDDLLARASSRLEPAPTSRDDAAFWLYSSGSTGFPKGAVHLHHDMVVCQETYARQVLGIRESDKVYSAAKLFFAYGLGNAGRSEEHTSELQSPCNLVCRLLLEKKKKSQRPHNAERFCPATSAITRVEGRTGVSVGVVRAVSSVRTT